MTAPDTPQADPPAQVRSRPSWLMAVLVVSLAFNLFVIGAVAAHHLWWRDDGHRMGRISGPGFTQLLPRRFFAEISADRRNELQALMREHRNEFRDGRHALRVAARAVADALDAEPFDQARLDAALHDFTESGHALIDMGAKVAGDVISRLSADERKNLAEQLLLRSRVNSRGSETEQPQ
jgi:uncharacterized membrane protein